MDALKSLWRKNCFPKLSSKQIRVTSTGQVKVALLSRDLEIHASMREDCIQCISDFFIKLRRIRQARVANIIRLR